jgi:hypothetical protein
MLYSKDGSIPKLETDGTEGWVEVPDPPIPPEGMETVWWCPPGWVVRPPQPAPEEGYVWKWTQTEEQWNKYALDPVSPPNPTPEPTPTPDPQPTYTAGTASFSGSVTAGPVMYTVSNG